MACHGPPTLEDAQDLLRDGDPAQALAAARQAAKRAAKPEEVEAIRRVAFRAGLDAGWSHEAATEYLALREVLGGDDAALLHELSIGVFACAARSHDASRRLHEAALLGAAAAHTDGGPLLRDALRDGEPEVRAAAARATASWPEPELGLGYALELVESDPAPVVRREALRALADDYAARRDPAARPSVEPYLDAGVAGLGDADDGVRLAALHLLDTLVASGPAAHRPRAAAALADAVGHGSDAVSRAAARSLVAIDPEAAVAAWRASGPPATAGPLAAFADALAAHGDAGDAAAVRDRLADRRYAARLAAVQALRGPAAAAFVAELAAIAGDDPATTIRAAAIEALVSVGGEDRRVAAALEAALAHPHPATRRRAFLALRELETLETKALARLLERSDPAFVAEVADALARRGEAGYAALAAALDRPATAVAALGALARRGDPRLRERFVALLDSPDPRRRELAAVGLARCGGPADRPALVRSIERPAGRSDLAAAAALLAIEDRSRRGVSASN